MMCPRCENKVSSHIGSMFNTQQICLMCAGIERRHPAYSDAREAEGAAVQKGDYNFVGIGLPDDLMTRARAMEILIPDHLKKAEEKFAALSRDDIFACLLLFFGEEKATTYVEEAEHLEGQDYLRRRFHSLEAVCRDLTLYFDPD